MSLSYKLLCKKPLIFSRMTGISIKDFDKLKDHVSVLWKEKVEGCYKRKAGRHYKLGIDEMLMAILIYYRCYMSHEFLGCLFSIHQSQMTRIINKMRPLLAEIIDLKAFKRDLTKEDVEKLVEEAILVDATEQRIERPKHPDQQKPYYSGKKKTHTVKTEIRVNRKGKIFHVSKTVVGSMHDLKLHESEPRVDPRTRMFVDSGYQGLQETHPHIDMPYKRSKNKDLTEEEKEYNAALARVRISVEHTFGDIKVFRILKEVYRNDLSYYGQIFRTIAGIVNIKNGFATLS